MVQNFEYLRLLQSFLALVFGHFADVDLFDNGQFFVGLALHEVSSSKTTHTKRLDLLVALILLLGLT